MQDFDPSGRHVLITCGEFAGEEGVCLGLVPDGSGLWAVSPHASDRIANLKFEQEFGILVNGAQEPGRN